MIQIFSTFSILYFLFLLVCEGRRYIFSKLLCKYIEIPFTLNEFQNCRSKQFFNKELNDILLRNKISQLIKKMTYNDSYTVAIQCGAIKMLPNTQFCQSRLLLKLKCVLCSKQQQLLTHFHATIFIFALNSLENSQEMKLQCF